MSEPNRKKSKGCVKFSLASTGGLAGGLAVSSVGRSSPLRMRVSEKSLELNVGAELLWTLRNDWHMPKIYLRGLTQREESQQGADCFAQLGTEARLFAFQFKAPLKKSEGLPYRFTLSREQHDMLFNLARGWLGCVYYVLPFYVTESKLQADLPRLLEDTWFLDIRQMETSVIFGNYRTKRIRCDRGQAYVNPEFKINRLTGSRERAQIEHLGIPAEAFANWYRSFREHRMGDRTRRNPWLARGLRVAVYNP